MKDASRVSKKKREEIEWESKVRDVPLTLEQFITHNDRLMAQLDYELGKDVVEKLNPRQTNRALARGGDRHIWLHSIAGMFRGVNCIEFWRVAGNVRFRDGKERKTPITYMNPGRSKEPCLAEQLRERYKNRSETMRLLDDLESCIRAYLHSLNANICSESPGDSEQMRKSPFSVELMRSLACVWIDDSKMLKTFLSTMFQRWRKIDDPKSVWRRRMVIDQKSTEFGHDCKRLQEYLESIGAVEKVSTARQENAVRNLIAQDLSRGLRNRKRNQ